MSYLVHVPEARGRVMPEMDSMSEDFPALCEPRTAMTGISRSRWALWDGKRKKTQTLHCIGPAVVLTPSREGD
jgi:hypothetical protein